MLIYHQEDDSLFWDEDFDLDMNPACSDVSEELWAVERARDLDLPFPDLERHLAYLRDLAENEPPAVPDADDDIWGGL